MPFFSLRDRPDPGIKPRVLGFYSIWTQILYHLSHQGSQYLNNQFT